MENEKKSQAILMQQHIDACKASGQTVAAYCSGHSIKAHQYYYWQSKLQPAAPGKFISIAVPLSTYPLHQPLIVTVKLGPHLCVYGK